jgi:5-methylcytosine-specific restriction protein A
MPKRASRTCSVPGCPNLVTDRRRSLCGVHQKEEWKRQDALRGSSAQRGYGARWRQTSKAFLESNPWCARCNGAATVAHHRVRRRDGGTDDSSNLIPLCKSCHSAIHAETGEYF